MNHQRWVWALLAAVLLCGAFGVSEANAYGPRRAYLAPSVPYYSYQTYGYSYYNPYVMPLPGYGILPLPLTTGNWGYGFDYPVYGTRPTADTYTYPRYPQAPPPSMRPMMYPAVPFGQSPEAAQADGRRVRFEITVPYADAVVTFDGVKTKQTGLNRVFVTPPLDEGKEYTLTIAVQFTQEDGSLTQPRQRMFTVSPGQTIQHKFID